MHDRLVYDDHILDPCQTVEEADRTAYLLEQHCAALCPDGTREAQWRYDTMFVHALRN